MRRTQGSSAAGVPAVNGNSRTRALTRKGLLIRYLPAGLIRYAHCSAWLYSTAAVQLLTAGCCYVSARAASALWLQRVG
jgi:hypothetical protein